MVPALRFIGIRYRNDDRKDGGFGSQWDEWNAGDRFEKLKKAAGCAPYDEPAIGLMTMRGDATGFACWTGLFFPENTGLPEKFGYLDLPESTVGVGWVRGSNKNGEIYGAPPHERFAKITPCKFRNDIAGEGSDPYCFFESYNCQRFTEQEENGNLTLDYGNYLR